MRAVDGSAEGAQIGARELLGAFDPKINPRDRLPPGAPQSPTTVGTPPSCWLHHRIPCLGAMQMAMPLQGKGLEKTVPLALAKSGQQLTDNYSTGNSFKPGLDGVPKGRPQASHPQDRTKVPPPPQPP